MIDNIMKEIDSFQGDISVVIKDLKNDQWLFKYNENEIYSSASIIKVPIMVEAFYQVEKGQLKLDQKIKVRPEDRIKYSIVSDLSLDEYPLIDLISLMIIVSDNIATNIIIDYLGIDNINNTIQDLGFKNTVLHNKIDFKRYDRLGTTTPREYGLVFEKICKEELWSPEISRQMLSIFKEQRYNNMLTRAFPQYYLDSEDTGDEELIYIASKSGSMDACRNDGGIVSTPYGKYVVAIFTKNFKDPLYYVDHESTLFGAKVSRLLFDQYIGLGGRFRL